VSAQGRSSSDLAGLAGLVLGLAAMMRRRRRGA
jgi:MYXO-CTERM domain-containing protein